MDTENTERPVEAALVKAATVAVSKPKRVKPKSRGQRWAEAASNAAQALSELQDIQSEFSDWNDNLPENLRGSALGEKLQTVCDLDISSALDTANEAENADLPLGFGRD